MLRQFVRNFLNNSIASLPLASKSRSRLSRRLKDPRRRSLRLESLERRELLSVTTTGLDADVDDASASTELVETVNSVTTTDTTALVGLDDSDAVTTTASDSSEDAVTTVTSDSNEDVVTTVTSDSGDEDPVTTAEDEEEEEEESDVQFGAYDATTRSVKLNWTDDSSNETGFRIEYSTDGGNKWRLSQITGRNVTSRTVYGVKPNAEYTFRVCELHGCQKGEWAYSETLQTTVNLDAPSDVATGDYDATTRSVKLSWTDNSNCETGFRVEYSTDGGETWRISQITARNVTSRTIYGVKPDAEYAFRVCALRGADKSAWATSETLDTSAVFTAPTDLTFGTYNAKKRRVTLSWTDTSNAETGFRVEYSTDGGSTWRISQIRAFNKTSCTVYGVKPNAEYMFRVCALRGVQKTAWTTSETFDTGATPAAPTDVTPGEYDSEAKTVSVSWTDNSKDEQGFRVEYTTDDGETWTLVEETEANVTTITAKDVEANETYQFRVAAFRNNKTSSWAVSEELDTSEVVAPSDVTLGEYDAEEETVSVSWTDNSDDETGFRIEQTTDDGVTWTLSGEADADATTFTAEDVEANQTYKFRVCALRDSKQSDWAVSEELDTTTAPNAPSDVTLGEYDAEAETLPMTWKDNSDDETGFRIEYTTDGGETWSLSEIVDANVTTREATSVHTSRTYQFRVCAIRDDEQSDWALSVVWNEDAEEEEEEDVPQTSGVANSTLIDPRVAFFENFAVEDVDLFDVEL